MKDLADKGEVTIDGDKAKFQEFSGMLDKFNVWFPIMTPKEN